jgi:hypothetical protein
LPGKDTASLQSRVEAWKEAIGPRGAAEDYLVERAARISWQLDRADGAIAARLADRIRRHDREREAREADVVAHLARGLFQRARGPIGLGPAWIVHRLESTAAGCRWLLDRWGELRKPLEDGRNWTATDRLRAIHLMGRQPLDCLEDDRVMAIYLACGAMNPDGEHQFLDLCTELERDERFRFIDRVRDLRPFASSPSTPEAGKARLLDFVAGAVTQLEALLRAHLDRQAPDRSGALDRLALDDAPDGELLRRDRDAHGRMLLQTVNTIIKVRKLADDRPVCSGKTDVGPSATVEPATVGPDEVDWSRVLERAGISPTDLQESRPSDQSAPSAAGCPVTIPMDPCSEGRHTEPAIPPAPPILTTGRPKKAGRARSGGRGPSQPMPPMLMQMLKQVLQREATGAQWPPLADAPASDIGPP